MQSGPLRIKLQTKQALDLAHSASLLIILNDAVGILNPNAVCSKAASLLQRPRTGRSAAEMVDFVWMIFESHVVGNAKEIRNYPSILMLGDGSARHPWFQAFFDDLQAKWAEANKALLLDLRGIDEGKFSLTLCRR